MGKSVGREHSRENLDWYPNPWEVAVRQLCRISYLARERRVSPRTDRHEGPHSWQSSSHLSKASEIKTAALKPCPQPPLGLGRVWSRGPLDSSGEFSWSAPFLHGLGQPLKGLEASRGREGQQQEVPKWLLLRGARCF